MEWKTGLKARNGENNGKLNGKQALAWQGQKWPSKWPGKWRKNGQLPRNLDWRNRVIVIAESRNSYRRIANKSYRWRVESLAFVGGHISPQITKTSPHRPYVHCAAIRIARLASIRLTFIPRGTAERPARVDCVR